MTESGGWREIRPLWEMLERVVEGVAWQGSVRGKHALSNTHKLLPTPIFPDWCALSWQRSWLQSMTIRNVPLAVFPKTLSTVVSVDPSHWLLCCWTQQSVSMSSVVDSILDWEEELVFVLCHRIRVECHFLSMFPGCPHPHPPPPNLSCTFFSA